MPCGIAIVYMAVNRHVFIQSPTGRAVIDNNITHTVTSQSIIPEEHILRPRRKRIWRIIISCVSNGKRLLLHKPHPRSCLTCNSDIRSTDVYRGFQPDNARNIEHNNTRTTGLTCLTQCSGPTVGQRIDHNYFSSTSTGSIGPSLLPRERQVCCSLLNPPVWMPMVYKDVLEQPQTLLQVMLSPMPHPISGLFPLLFFSSDFYRIRNYRILCRHRQHTCSQCCHCK